MVKIEYDDAYVYQPLGEYSHQFTLGIGKYGQAFFLPPKNR